MVAAGRAPGVSARARRRDRAQTRQVEYLIEARQPRLPKARLGPEDVAPDDGGLRPLLAEGAGGTNTPSQTSREHELFASPRPSHAVAASSRRCGAGPADSRVVVEILRDKGGRKPAGLRDGHATDPGQARANATPLTGPRRVPSDVREHLTATYALERLGTSSRARDGARPRFAHRTRKLTVYRGQKGRPRQSSPSTRAGRRRAMRPCRLFRQARDQASASRRYTPPRFGEIPAGAPPSRQSSLEAYELRRGACGPAGRAA